MEIFKQIAPLRAYLKIQKERKLSIGLVPTMGALHPGHLTLIGNSRAENDLTVCSIYVNPTQFNNASDLAKYPRLLEKDSAMLEEAGCDVLFAPANEAMYAAASELKMDFGDLDKILEGKFRPGHFSGVGLVVSKLFNIVQPDVAYFGQKDYQQFAVITRLKEELLFDLRLKAVPIVREKDGLAMSSRNMRLAPDQRQRAIVFYQSLLLAKSLLEQGKSWKQIEEEVKRKCEAQPEVKLEYIALADRKNLNPLNNVTDRSAAVLLIAGYVGEIRLIDNLLLEE
ncbi:MAG: pantoate--beta-alanine ligase [Azospira oryzae]|jgi:pantoate--beta-alanine ligase|nr:MAG: pantoate--beta-alanine ligase [Azospira oryzae]